MRVGSLPLGAPLLYRDIASHRWVSRDGNDDTLSEARLVVYVFHAEGCSSWRAYR